MKNKLSTRNRGQIAQLQVELRANYKGFSTSKPQTELDYDLIIDTGKDLLKAQIKYCNRFNGNPDRLELKLYNEQSNRPYYSDSNIDILLVYIPKINQVLAYNSKMFNKKKTLAINLLNKNSKFYYEKFIW